MPRKQKKKKKNVNLPGKSSSSRFHSIFKMLTLFQGVELAKEETKEKRQISNERKKTLKCNER